MVDINYENLPAPMGFVIDLQEADLWEYHQEGASEENPTELTEVFNSDSYQVFYTVIPPGEVLPWHTHEPHTAQLFWILEGRLESSYKDNDGEVHTVEVSGEDEELIYIPAGAHNRQENVGDVPVRLLSFKTHGGAVKGRIEHLVDDPEKHYDPDADPEPPALDILPRRGHIFHKDEDAVSDW